MDSVELLKFLTRTLAILTVLSGIYTTFFAIRGIKQGQKMLHPSMVFMMGLLTMMMVCGNMNELNRRAISPAPVDGIVIFLVGFFLAIYSMTVSYYALWKKQGNKFN